MNNILSVKLPFQSEKNPNKPGPRNLNKTRTVSSDALQQLILELEGILDFYSDKGGLIKDCLVDVAYVDVISKSGRMQEIFKSVGGDCNDLIVGARFSKNNRGNHIITYYVTRECIITAISNLKEVSSFIDKALDGRATSENFKSDLDIDYGLSSLPKTKLRGLIVDCSAIDSFGVPNVNKDGMVLETTSIVTFYSTEIPVSEILEKLSFPRSCYYLVSKNTLSVGREFLETLMDKVPYLISMVATDISKITPCDLGLVKKENISIPSPHGEPIIGVIDTLFDQKAYFSEWVDYRETLEEMEKNFVSSSPTDFRHGTSVSSIIVDGASLNPWLNDGCGRFRVRHFGVCKERIPPSRLVRKIEEIVRNNLDIHVWNMSLGTEEEVSNNFVSFDSAALDALEAKYDVIFVLPGTNDNRSEKQGTLRIGSPADSLNSLVVNAVKKSQQPASYSRTGPVLSFYKKPDVSYYGGDFDERILAYSNNGVEEVYGTSYAAPWIARKLSYLIDVLGFSREEAKALLIDAAANWSYKQDQNIDHNVLGYGVVPISIFDVVRSKEDEIRFVVSGVSNAYRTSNYALPVPKDEGEKSFYVARATLCYFPSCNRLQGVDYTERELSIKFGIVGKGHILDINQNTQDEEEDFSNERKARSDFRKWENTKFISSKLTMKNKPKKVYGDGFYGLSIVSKERRRYAKQESLKFGVVVTLKNIKGENRIEEFKHACLLRGYIVNEVEVQNRLEVYNLAQEEIRFDD